VSKTDLVDEATFNALSERLTRINRRAPIRVVEHGNIDLAELLDVRWLSTSMPILAAD